MSDKKKNPEIKYPNTVEIHSELSMIEGSVLGFSKGQVVIPHGRMKRGYPEVLKTTGGSFYLNISFQTLVIDDRQPNHCVIKYEDLEGKDFYCVTGQDFPTTLARFYNFIKQNKARLNPKKPKTDDKQ